jgi:hypothetical protein
MHNAETNTNAIFFSKIPFSIFSNIYYTNAPPAMPSLTHYL